MNYLVMMYGVLCAFVIVCVVLVVAWCVYDVFCDVVWYVFVV